jgi:hypothetical protein
MVKIAQRSKPVKVPSRGYANRVIRRFDQGPIPEVWVVILPWHRDPKHTVHYTRVAAGRFEGLWR